MEVEYDVGDRVDRLHLLIWTDSFGEVELMEAEITSGAEIWLLQGIRQRARITKANVQSKTRWRSHCVDDQRAQRLVKMLVAFRLGLQPELDLDS